MAIKKSQIYASLWDSCDTLRGGMDASQYKDYILALLFVKYVSDKAKDDPYALYVVPEDAGFDAMLQLRNKPDIGDQMNKMLARLMEANRGIDISFPDFNDEKLLGKGKDMVDKLTKLLNIFNDGLNLAKNRAGNDDLLGDAYEYLMRHFAVESGKSKGQFYTPAEVSRLLAVVIGIHEDSRPQVTLYDPTCGSGSLLLRAASCASAQRVNIYGQEDVATTADLARMNMVLHGQATAEIHKGNTLSSPGFIEGSKLTKFDYVVANPPFSVKNWTNGFSPNNDVYNRFEYGLPPEKMGDYAFLQHIIASMKTNTGRAVCIMPHGVLFRGNAEEAIREKIVRQGFIKAIIGLPANLFYGTPIAACVLVMDKNNASNRAGIFMIDASKGFMKDGPKNRLREQDLRRMIDTYTNRLECPGYSRMVPMSEIQKNGYNLNIPRYIDGGDTEVRQDIFAHLNGGIPQEEIDAMPEFRQGFAGIKSAIFSPSPNPGYSLCNLAPGDIRKHILASDEFASFRAEVEQHLERWKQTITPSLKQAHQAASPSEVIAGLENSVLKEFAHSSLLDKYDVYQRLMEYADTTLRDDLYLVAEDGWKASIDYEKSTNKKGVEKIKSWECELLPKSVVTVAFVPQLGAKVAELQADVASLSADVKQMKEEQTGEDGFLGEEGKVDVKKRLTEIKRLKTDESDDAEEYEFLMQYTDINKRLDVAKKAHKAAEQELDAKLTDLYAGFTADDVCQLVVHCKWIHALLSSMLGETDRLIQAFSARLKVLTERYENPLPELENRVNELQGKVQQHLNAMGFKWKGETQV